MWRYNSNMENIRVKDEYKLSRILYIIEASLEYFISIGISLTYLPVLGAALGMEGSLIAIIESFVSLGASFQIFAVPKRDAPKFCHTFGKNDLLDRTAPEHTGGDGFEPGGKRDLGQVASCKQIRSKVCCAVRQLDGG